MTVYRQRLRDQQSRALALSQEHCCPHCRKPIALVDALSMVRGHGYAYHVTIQLPDGTRVPIPERDFSPQTMLLAGD